MKKIFVLILIVLIIIVTLFSCYYHVLKTKYGNTVIYNGKISVQGQDVVNQYGEKIVLHGLSSSGIQWNTSDCINENTLKYLNKNWNVNVFRIAVYSEEDGYVTNKEKILKKAEDLVDKCIDANIYAIVDWHINKDGNPNTHKKEAIDFFENITQKYGKSKNIIYEICNEPNNVNWNDDIYPYANELIPIIRKNSPDSIIIVGTPNYCQNPEEVLGNELHFKNILYSFHFYAGTHFDGERQKLDNCYTQGLPIIVSEWGTSEYTGSGQNDFESADKWMNYLKEKGISWVNWSYSYKNETSAILKNTIKDNLDDIENNLTKSGVYIRNALKNQC